MFSQNPFAEVSASVPPVLIQAFVIIMVILVIAGTAFDVIHKKSAKYFSESWRRSKENGSKQVSGSEVVSLALQTAVSEVLTSSEFCNPNRRIAHLLTMYGLVVHVVATAALVFGYPAMADAGIWPLLWHLGALAVCVGGYWFWFFIRVDVAAEGNSPFRVIRADLFILSLLASATLALIWSAVQAAGTSVGSYIFFGLYLAANAVLFGGVPWSKFAHMFFKPAAAVQKHVAEASGARDNLPPPADQPEQFGLGIKRELPRHY
ncbi:MAG: adenylyl-sulfate reductase [Gammaproteobacteria bacterium]|nr:adenylyl-sulfate reductase [Gammaproteobacteria bacterium]MDH3447953.1 adenylyl-sulfate reductase [Gammaproteobacteria bacterium]